MPEAALDSIKETLTCVDDLQSNLLNFLSAAEPDVLAELPPLQRARAFLVLAQSASTLLAGKSQFLLSSECIVLNFLEFYLVGICLNSEIEMQRNSTR